MHILKNKVISKYIYFYKLNNDVIDKLKLKDYYLGTHVHFNTSIIENY